MAQLQLKQGRLLLSGVLDHARVAALQPQLVAALAAASEAHLVIDCSQVSRANSAGLALVLAAMRQAQARNKTFSVEHLPQDMRQMAHVCGLDPLPGQVVPH